MYGNYSKQSTAKRGESIHSTTSSKKKKKKELYYIKRMNGDGLKGGSLGFSSGDEFWFEVLQLLVFTTVGSPLGVEVIVLAKFKI